MRVEKWQDEPNAAPVAAMINVSCRFRLLGKQRVSRVGQVAELEPSYFIQQI